MCVYVRVCECLCSHVYVYVHVCVCMYVHVFVGILKRQTVSERKRNDVEKNNKKCKNLSYRSISCVLVCVCMRVCVCLSDRWQVQVKVTM